MRDAMTLDLDEEALVKRPKPVGWFAAGVLGVALVGTVVGLYLPLSSAHGTLAEAYEKLAKKSGELDATLKASEATLQATETERKDLARFVKQGMDRKTALTSQVELLAATAENGLAAFTKAELATVVVENDAVVVGFKPAAIFVPRANRLNPRASVPLCKVSQLLSQERDFTLTAVVIGSGSEKNAWKDLGEKASALSEVLNSSCKVDVSRLSVQLQLTESGTAFDSGNDLKDMSVLLRVGPKQSQLLDPENAPASTAKVQQE